MQLSEKSGGYSDWGKIPLEEISKMVKLQASWEKSLTDAIQSVQDSELVAASTSRPIVPIFNVSFSDNLKISFLIC